MGAALRKRPCHLMGRGFRGGGKDLTSQGREETDSGTGKTAVKEPLGYFRGTSARGRKLLLGRKQLFWEGMERKDEFAGLLRLRSNGGGFYDKLIGEGNACLLQDRFAREYLRREKERLWGGVGGGEKKNFAGCRGRGD